MNKQLKKITLVSTLILTTIFTGSFASDGINKTVEVKNTNKIELKTNKEVINILTKKGKKIVKKNAKDLNLYITVMDLYSNSPAKFYNLDKTTKSNFFDAVENLNESLSNARNKEVKSLAPQVEFNSAVSKFIWDVKNSYSQPVSIVKETKETSL